jgi:HSP20 family protein
VYQPPTDVYETDRQVVVRLEIAGLEPDDFEVLVSNEAEVLTIAGKRPDPAGGAHRKYFNMEIECGDFARQLRIPAPIVSDQISATYADGFLTITMPKQSDNSSSARNVPIS